MKAITRRTYGQPEVIKVEDIPEPTPKAKEIKVRVHATTINRTDCAIITGTPFIFRFFIGGLKKPKYIVPGTDFAGEVTELGSEVTNFKVGDKVWGFNDEGLQTQAQYMTIDENKEVLKMPEGYSYEEVAACAEGPHYAYNFLYNLGIEKHHKVLLNGATGGIGTAALQMLKNNGVYVTAVCNTKNLDLIKSLGADRVYNYETEDFTTDTERYDFVCDAVGKSRFPYCKPLLKEGGIYISSELGKGTENLYLPLLTIFSKKKVKFPIPSKPKRSIVMMNELLAQGKYKPVIDRTYSMEEIQEAYTYVMSGQKTGNVVLKID